MQVSAGGQYRGRMPFDVVPLYLGEILCIIGESSGGDCLAAPPIIWGSSPISDWSSPRLNRTRPIKVRKRAAEPVN